MTLEEKEKKLSAAFDVYESFQKDFDYTNRHTKSFAESMWKIIEKEQATYLAPNGKQITTHIRDRNHFSEITGLGPSTYDRIKKGKDDYVPSIRTFMTLCMVYALNITVVRDLRHTYGYDFNAKNRLHQAYIYLLVNCRGRSLSYCNQVLKVLGVDHTDFLGDGTIDEDEIAFDILGETK